MLFVLVVSGMLDHSRCGSKCDSIDVVTKKLHLSLCFLKYFEHQSARSNAMLYHCTYIDHEVFSKQSIKDFQSSMGGEVLTLRSLFRWVFQGWTEQLVKEKSILLCLFDREEFLIDLLRCPRLIVTWRQVFQMCRNGGMEEMFEFKFFPLGHNLKVQGEVVLKTLVNEAFCLWLLGLFLLSLLGRRLICLLRWGLLTLIEHLSLLCRPGVPEQWANLPFAAL